MKNLPKIFKIFFLTIFVLQLIGFIVLLLAPMPSQAAEIPKFNPQVTIPGSEFEHKTQTEEQKKAGTKVGITIEPTSIAKYINAVYKYAIGIVGILATVVMMFGGFMYMMAGGDSGKLSEAKEWIKASITGLIIALSSFMILNTVSPSLTQLGAINAPGIAGPGCCTYTPAGKAETKEEMLESICKSSEYNGQWKKGACGAINRVCCQKAGSCTGGMSNNSSYISSCTSGGGTIINNKTCFNNSCQDNYQSGCTAEIPVCTDGRVVSNKSRCSLAESATAECCCTQ